MPSLKRLTVDGITLAVKQWPATEDLRTPVVLLHATGETADDWDVVASALSSMRPVHAVNLRGHGPSDWPGAYSIQLLADDVAASLSQLANRPVDIVAHSLGGLVACKVASSRPELVGRLVLEDVGVLHARPPALPARPAAELAFDWRVVEQIRPEIDDPDPRWTHVIAHVSARTLVIAGGPSSTVPQQHVDDLVDALPDGQLVTIAAGHLVHATRPEPFIHAVRAFLD